jgi:hypothetical protein
MSLLSHRDRLFAGLIQRFPGAKGLTTAEVLARAEYEASDPGIAGYWAAIFPGEIPTGAEKVLPELLPADTLDLEGRSRSPARRAPRSIRLP